MSPTDLAKVVRSLLEAVLILFFDAVALPPASRGLLAGYGIGALPRVHLDSEAPVSRIAGHSAEHKATKKSVLTNGLLAGHQVLLARFDAGYGRSDLGLGTNTQIWLSVPAKIMEEMEKGMSVEDLTRYDVTANRGETSKRNWACRLPYGLSCNTLAGERPLPIPRLPLQVAL